MIRVALITSDPGALRGVLGELAVFSDSIEIYALQPPGVSDEISKHRLDVILLDIQAVSHTDAQALTDVICDAHVRGSFVCCCSGCPTDRERINVIEEVGAEWCPLPASGVELAAFIHKVHERPHQDGIVDAGFLAALWELVAEEESKRQLTFPPRPGIHDRDPINERPGWIESLGNALARIVRHRPRVSRA
jgi:hypothetical protein